MSAKANAELMLEVFRAIERRDLQRVRELCHPDVEVHWPSSLPYGGVSRGVGGDRPSWSETWIPLQPTDVERRMNPRVVSAREEEVVVLWHQRWASPVGDRFEGAVLGLYRIRDRKLGRAQMFHFDTAALIYFLGRATGTLLGNESQSRSA